MRRSDLLAVGGLLLLGVATAVLDLAGVTGGDTLARLAGGMTAALAFCWLLGVLGRSPERSPFDAALRPHVRSAPDRASDFTDAERTVALHTTAGDVHLRLRPALRELAMHRLRISRGLDLDRDTLEVELLLGDRLAELVRADRPVPRDLRARSGLTNDDVSGLVQTLEAL
jgi:hypothetical protein